MLNKNDLTSKMHPNPIDADNFLNGEILRDEILASGDEMMRALHYAGFGNYCTIAFMQALVRRIIEIEAALNNAK